MTHRVLISDHLEQYRRAHDALIESLGGAGHLTQTSLRSGQSHWQVLEHNWYKLYRAKPVRKNSSWKWLDFEDEKQYILFVLKWS